MLILPAAVTVREARDTQRMLSQALQQGVRSAGDEPVSVDASGLAQFDSAALAVLLECRRKAQSFGRQFVVRQAPARLRSLARLYGVEDLLLQEDAAASS